VVIDHRIMGGVPFVRRAQIPLPQSWETRMRTPTDMLTYRPQLALDDGASMVVSVESARGYGAGSADVATPGAKTHASTCGQPAGITESAARTT
jgi:hypothetical protein